jgi:hypothetical protein
VIIGNHGSTIRTYAADSDTIIRVTSSQGSPAPTTHRIVTIAGARQNVLKVGWHLELEHSADTFHVVMKLLSTYAGHGAHGAQSESDDPKFLLYSELPTSEQPGKGGIIDTAFFGWPAAVLVGKQP